MHQDKSLLSLESTYVFYQYIQIPKMVHGQISLENTELNKSIIHG